MGGQRHSIGYHVEWNRDAVLKLTWCDLENRLLCLEQRGCVKKVGTTYLYCEMGISLVHRK